MKGYRKEGIFGKNWYELHGRYKKQVGQYACAEQEFVIEHSYKKVYTLNI